MPFVRIKIHVYRVRDEWVASAYWTDQVVYAPTKKEAVQKLKAIFEAANHYLTNQITPLHKRR